MSNETEQGDQTIVLRKGGYFVEWKVGWSGPWKTLQAAELARDGDFRAAHAAERATPLSPP